MRHWKILYFHNTVKPHFTDTGSITIPHYYGQFALSLRKESLLSLLTLALLKSYANVEKTGTSQRRKTNKFNNNKLLAVQDKSNMNTPEEENTHVQYTKVTHYAAGTACWHYIFSKFNLNSTDNL